MHMLEALSIVTIGAVLFIVIQRAQRQMEESKQNSTALALAGALSVIIAWGVARYFHTVAQARLNPDGAEVLQPGQSFRAIVQSHIAHRPLLTEIDFNSTDVARKPNLLVVDTPHTSLTFDTVSGTIVRYTSKRLIDGKPGELTVFNVDPLREREGGAFLLAFEHEAPLNYTRTNQIAEENATSLTFTAQTPHGTIVKTYRIEHTSYQLHFTLSIHPRSGITLRPRLLITGPYSPDITNNTMHGIVWSDRETLEMDPVAQLDARAWKAPTLFGATDRYFVQALIKDPNNFVMRAYYRPMDPHHTSTLLEGPDVTTDQTWTLSFYIGPKILSTLQAADQRLVKTLNYGWFHTIAVILQTALEYVHTGIKNYGLAIIIVVFLTKLIMLPLNISAEKRRRKMSELQSKISYLERKHKGNPQLLEQEKFELLKKHGVGDMLSSIVLGLVQVFVLIGIQRILATSYELYRTPFFGWIHDLSAVDPYMILPALTACSFVLRARADAGVLEVVKMLVLSVVGFGIFSYFSAGSLLALCTIGWFDVVQSFIQSRWGRA